MHISFNSEIRVPLSADYGTEVLFLSVIEKYKKLIEYYINSDLNQYDNANNLFQIALNIKDEDKTYSMQLAKKVKKYANRNVTKDMRFSISSMCWSSMSPNTSNNISAFVISTPPFLVLRTACLLSALKLP